MFLERGDVKRTLRIRRRERGNLKAGINRAIRTHHTAEQSFGILIHDKHRRRPFWQRFLSNVNPSKLPLGDVLRNVEFHPQVVIRGQRNRLPGHRFCAWLRAEVNHVITNRWGLTTLHPETLREGHHNRFKEMALFLSRPPNLILTLLPSLLTEIIRET